MLLSTDIWAAALIRRAEQGGAFAMVVRKGDPREAVTLELVFPTRTGERVETTLFEVGDFAAGRAFLAATR